MKEEEIFQNLCVYDKRHPRYREPYLPRIPYQNDLGGCPCNNCRNGRTELALEILRSREHADIAINKILNKALVGKNSIKSPDSNKIAQFIIDYFKENDK